MFLLSIDTCGPLGTVALARLQDDSLHLLGQTELPGKTYSAQLIPAIRELLAAHGTALPDLAAIATVSGPGSFTGIRIALSAAKGLAEVHPTPLLAISRLAVLAHKAGTRAAALDASRGELYFGDYAAEPGESLLIRENFTAQAAPLASNLAVCEDSVRALVPSAALVAPPTAADALSAILPRLRAGDFDNPLTLDGNYIRRSDAEIFAKPAPGPAPVSAPRHEP